MNVSSSPFLYFTTMDSRKTTIHTHIHTQINYSLRMLILFSFTKVFSAFVLVDVYVDLFDGLQSLGQLGVVGVALRCGSQKLHQQKRVTHHPLNRLD